MAKDYLAMYLYLTISPGKASHFIPIMLFAENSARLAQDIENNAFFKSITEVREAVDRISTPFSVTVLALPPGSASGVLFSRAAAQEQARLMASDLIEFFMPAKAPVISAPEAAMIRIWIGIKNRKTPYPNGFIDPWLNFKRERFVFQFSNAQITPGSLIAKGELFFTLTFHHPTPGQIFFTPLG